MIPALTAHVAARKTYARFMTANEQTEKNRSLAQAHGGIV